MFVISVYGEYFVVFHKSCYFLEFQEGYLGMHLGLGAKKGHIRGIYLSVKNFF